MEVLGRSDSRLGNPLRRSLAVKVPRLLVLGAGRSVASLLVASRPLLDLAARSVTHLRGAHRRQGHLCLCPHSPAARTKRERHSIEIGDTDCSADNLVNGSIASIFGISLCHVFTGWWIELCFSWRELTHIEYQWDHLHQTQDKAELATHAHNRARESDCGHSHRHARK